MTGDHVLVDKMAYAPAGEWSRWALPYEKVTDGDIVTFRYPVDPKQTFVKRVMGVPGDRIRLLDRAVWRNGVELYEPYVQHVFGPNEYRDNFPASSELAGGLFPSGRAMLECCVHDGELVVPPGSYFVMGDNRDNSSDSRYWGFVPAENVTGKPVLVWWSYEAGGDALTDFVNLPHLWDMATHFFTKTRWNRTMRVVRGAA